MSRPDLDAAAIERMLMPMRCPKCMSMATPMLRWCGGGFRQIKSQTPLELHCKDGEHLHRTCATCGWLSIVPCADAPEAA